MAMYRTLSQSLHRPYLRPPVALTTHRRHRSSKRSRAQLIEVVEIDHSPADSTEAAAEVITLGIKKLEDAIHGIIVRRSAPDWLPFLPGSSYWVPPRASSMRGGGAAQHHARSLVDVIGKMDASRVRRDHQGVSFDLLSEDENMAFTSAKGWPASSFYIEGTSPVHPIPHVEIEAKYQDNDDKEDNTSSSEEDEE